MRVDFNIHDENLSNKKLRVIDAEEDLELKNYIFICFCYLNQDMYEETLEYTDKVLTMIPCHDIAIQVKAKALMYLKRFDEYEILIEEAKGKTVYENFFLKQDPSNPSFGQIIKLQTQGNYANMCQDPKDEPYKDGENFIPYATGVEIKRDDITGGFGLFAARDIKPGEMIMVDKTLHFCCDQGKLHDKDAQIGLYPNRYNEKMMCAGL